MFWFCNVDFLLILITCHWTLGCKSLSVFYVCVKGKKHSFSTIIFFPDSILHMRFLPAHLFFPQSICAECGTLVILCSAEELQIVPRQQHLCGFAANADVIDRTHTGISFPLCQVATLSEERTLYFTLCHASEMKVFVSIQNTGSNCFEKTVWGKLPQQHLLRLALLGLLFQMS